MTEPLSRYCDVNKQSLGREAPSDFRFRYIDLSSVNEGEIDWHKTRTLSLVNSPSRARRIVQPGDVLFSTVRPGLMGHAIVREPADLPIIGSTGFAVLSPKSDADGRFIFHSLFLDSFRRQVAQFEVGSNYPAINESDLRRILLGTIDGPKQKLIADILDALDDAILETEMVIEKRQAIQLGLHDDLIATPSQVGQSEAPDTLADVVASISSGCSVNADDRTPTAGEFGVLKTSAVGGGRFRAEQSKAVWSREVNRLKCPVVAGLILFSRMNTPLLVGENAFVDRDYPGLFLPDRLWAIRVKEDEGVVASWVATILQTRQARSFITGEATGTSGSMKNIAQKSLLRLPIRKLPERDQTDAIKTIAALQAEIDGLMAERDKLADLRLGLRDDLLSGRKSVVAVREAAE